MSVLDLFVIVTKSVFIKIIGKIEKVKIISAQTRNMLLEKDVDLDQVASKLPNNFTGADFGALTSEAYMIAV